MSFNCSKCQKENKTNHEPIYGYICMYCGFCQDSYNLPIYNEMKIHTHIYESLKKDVIKKINGEINEIKNQKNS